MKPPLDPHSRLKRFRASGDLGEFRVSGLWLTVFPALNMLAGRERLSSAISMSLAAALDLETRATRILLCIAQGEVGRINRYVHAQFQV